MRFFKKRTPESFRNLWLVTVGVLAVKSAYVFATPMRVLASTTWLIDDSLIEMRIARNIALGQGFSLDGIHTTTGAPFLWIYLSSITHFFFDKDIAIRMTLILTAVCAALAALVVFFLALKLTKDKRIAWTSFLMATFTGNAFFNGLNGMDTALFTFFALAAIAAFFDVGRPKHWSEFSWGCVTGLFAGLTCMTRGDGIFVLGAIGLYKLIEIWNASGSDRKNMIRGLTGLVAAWGVLFAIFMGWQLIQTGSPFPANQVGRRGLSVAFHGFSFDNFSLSHYLKIVLWNVFQLEELLRVAMGSALLALVAWGASLLRKDLRPLATVTFFYLSVFFALLVAYQWYFADLHGLRYINPAVHLGFIFIAAMLWSLPDVRYKTAVVSMLTLSIITVAGYKHYQLCSRLPWAKYMTFLGRPDPELNTYFWSTIDWMHANMPAETIVGVRDYGRISLFTDLRIQDLAGNIDPQVAVALGDGTLDAYLKERNVEYLYIPSVEQRPDKLYQYLHANLKLELVPEAPRSPTQSLYRIVEY